MTLAVPIFAGRSKKPIQNIIAGEIKNTCNNDMLRILEDKVSCYIYLY